MWHFLYFKCIHEYFLVRMWKWEGCYNLFCKFHNRSINVTVLITVKLLGDMGSSNFHVSSTHPTAMLICRNPCFLLSSLAIIPAYFCMPPAYIPFFNSIKIQQHSFCQLCFCCHDLSCLCKLPLNHHYDGVFIMMLCNKFVLVVFQVFENCHYLLLCHFCCSTTCFLFHHNIFKPCSYLGHDNEGLVVLWEGNGQTIVGMILFHFNVHWLVLMNIFGCNSLTIFLRVSTKMCWS